MGQKSFISSGFEWIRWILATAIVAAGTLIGIIHYAYSDFETQRTSDIYRQQIDIRLGDIQKDVKDLNGNMSELNRKVDRLLPRDR